MSTHENDGWSVVAGMGEYLYIYIYTHERSKVFEEVIACTHRISIIYI